MKQAPDDYMGMTTTERLFAAGVLGEFDDALRIRDEAMLIRLLQRAWFTENEARGIISIMMMNPDRFSPK